MLVEDFWVAGVDLEGSGKVIYALLEAAHVVVAARTILKELYVVRLLLQCLFVVIDGLLILALRMQAAAKPILNGRSRLNFTASSEVDNGLLHRTVLQF